MGRLLVEPFATPYMLRALIMVLVIAVVAGVVGVVVQLRRMAFLVDALTHTVFPGVAVAFFAGWPLLLGALVAAVASAALLAAVARQRRLDGDAVLALLVAVFFSVGVVVVSRRPTFRSDLTELLFGRVLTVSAADVVQTAVVGALAVLVVGLLAKELLLAALDPEGAAALGYPVRLLDLALTVVVALVVVAAQAAVGTALVVALLITPAAVARLLTDRLGPLVVGSVAVAGVAGWLGLVASHEASIRHDVALPAGATIVVVLTATFLCVAAGGAIRRTLRSSRA